KPGVSAAPPRAPTAAPPRFPPQKLLWTHRPPGGIVSSPCPKITACPRGGAAMLARRSLLPLPLLLLAGCVPLQFLDSSFGEPETPMVPTNPFGTPAPVQQTPVKASSSPASGEMALRVDVVRHAVLAANPSLGVRPVAATIGVPHAEIFHQGTHIIYVTEGLIKR